MGDHVRLYAGRGFLLSPVSCPRMCGEWVGAVNFCNPGTQLFKEGKEIRRSEDQKIGKG
jgi:hypothetical protein